MMQTKYSDEEKFKIIAEVRSSGNIAATAKRYSIEVILFTFGMKKGCRRKEIPWRYSYSNLKSVDGILRG